MHDQAAPVEEQATQPVGEQTTDPALGTADQTTQPVTEPVPDPVLEPAEQAAGAAIETTGPVVEPVQEIVEPVVSPPVGETVEPDPGAVARPAQQTEPPMGPTGGLLGAGMRPEQVLRAVRAALRGETVLPRALLAEWVDEHRPPDLKVLLSARQREILGLLAEGATNAQIAGRLFLSESTVKQHLRAAYKALNVSNRTEAAKLIRDSS